MNIRKLGAIAPLLLVYAGFGQLDITPPDLDIWSLDVRGEKVLIGGWRTDDSTPFMRTYTWDPVAKTLTSPVDLPIMYHQDSLPFMQFAAVQDVRFGMDFRHLMVPLQDYTANPDTVRLANLDLDTQTALPVGPTHPASQSWGSDWNNGIGVNDILIASGGNVWLCDSSRTNPRKIAATNRWWDIPVMGTDNVPMLIKPDTRYVYRWKSGSFGFARVVPFLCRRLWPAGHTDVDGQPNAIVLIAEWEDWEYIHYTPIVNDLRTNSVAILASVNDAIYPAHLAVSTRYGAFYIRQQRLIWSPYILKAPLRQH